MIKIILACVASFSILVACHQRQPCLNNHINPAFKGFAPADIDTFVLRAYTPNNNYLHLIDTILVINLYATIYTTTNDTTVVYLNDSNRNRWIGAGFDWQIYIPARNRTITISNIKSTQTEGRGKVCWNPINSFEQDGQLILPQLIETGQFYTSGYRTNIHY